MKVIGIAVAVGVSYLVLALILGLSLVFLLGNMFENVLETSILNIGTAAGQTIAAAITLPIFYLILSSKRNPLRLYLKSPSRRDLLVALKYFGFFSWPLIGILILILILSRLGVEVPFDFASEPLLVSETILMFVLLVVVAPIIEEIIFRGYLYAKLRQRHSFWPAFWISGSIFTCFHILQSNLFELIVIFILSYFITRAFENTRSLWASILIHALNNARAFIFLFLL